MRDRKKRNIIIGALCCLLVFMGIGYAVLSQTLNISGTANMRGTWDIKITDISEASRTGKADPGTPTISTNGVSASFEANLWMPGDSITYNITVKNNGNIDAALKELVPSVENGVQQVKFSNNAVQGKVLRQSESYTFQVSVVFDEDATEIPKDSKTNPPKYTISLTFVQYTGNSLYTPTNETTDNSCFVINTAGAITGYDYNCGTVVTVPAEIDGIQVKSIAANTFTDFDSFNIWIYSKEESATLTKTYYIFKDQEARSLFLELSELTQEELDAEENTYNYLKGDPALQNIDLGVLATYMRVFKNANGEINVAYDAVPLTELDLSHADYLESIDLDSAPNLKKWNLNTKNPITFKSFSRKGYGPINYNWNDTAVGELEELIINVEVFNNTKRKSYENGITEEAFSTTHIKKLIILDESTTHKLEVTNTKEYGLFSGHSPGIENVIVDDGITELGTKSLCGLDIKSITLPNTLTTIGASALQSNTGLTSITIPSSVETIGSSALQYTGLTSITIPSSVETIGAYALQNTGLTSINFESNSKLKTVGDNALQYTGLTSITIPSSVETIGGSAFADNQITTINFESNSKLKTIGSGALKNNALTSITIPSSVETIGDSVFYYNQITTINFESNSKLKVIDTKAFGWNKLTNTGLGKLPSSLTSLDTNAFWENPNLTQITLTSPKDLPGWPNGGRVDGKTVTYER